MGGTGLISYYLLKEQKPGIDPLGPETKKKLDELRHPGQTYDGIIKELIERVGEKETGRK